MVLFTHVTPIKQIKNKQIFNAMEEKSTRHKSPFYWPLLQDAKVTEESMWTLTIPMSKWRTDNCVVQTTQKESIIPSVPASNWNSLQWVVKIKVSARSNQLWKWGIFRTGGFNFKLRVAATRRIKQTINI